MSERVKLIIEIPEELYDTIQADEMISREQLAVLQMDILRGTPLDDVTAEIKKSILDEPVENGTNAEMACYNGGLFKCLEIIDNIGKGDKE